ncbi:MAG: cation diffusion facilitator family transporter [Oligoflexia bacterium]|nr:cation diffusion facilitator family transporter [Oligoflexia bacterium]
MNSHTSIRSRAATLAVVTTVALTAFKLFVGVISGSVGVLSEGIHSFLDLVSAAVSYFTVRQAVKPADEDHPFGHGKIETLSSLFEALLLVAAAALIISEAVDHFRNPQPIQHQGLAMAAILISLVVSYFTYRHNLAAAEKTESSALRVNALHFLSDVVASGGVLAGLILMHFTGWTILDPLLGLAVAIYIVVITVEQIKSALLELSDVQLPPEELARIRAIVDNFKSCRVLGAHDVRTRRSGVTRHIDFHLVVCGSMSVDQSHAVCDQVEAKLLAEFPTASVNIHVEPCEVERSLCESGCPLVGDCGKECLK